MRVNSFYCAHAKLNKLALVIGAGLLLGAEEGEASTYSGTFTSSSPSFEAQPSVFYNIYELQAQSNQTYSFSFDDSGSMSLYTYKSYFDPSNISNNSPIKYHTGDTLGPDNHPYFVVITGNLNDSYSVSVSPAVTSCSSYDIHTGSSTISDTYKKGAIINSGTTSGLTFNFSDNESYVSNIGSTVTAVTKSGVGNLFLLGQNNYTGSTTISFGTLSLASSSIPSSSQINMSGGILGAAASFTLPNAILLNNASNTLDSQGQDLILSGAITGIHGLTVKNSGDSGTGSVSLTGANSYTGATTVTSGTLKLARAPNANQIKFNGGSFQASADLSGGNSLANAISVSSATTFDTNSHNVTLTGAITGSGDITKIGTGILTLDPTSGADTQSGILVINEGTLAIGSQVNDISGDPSISLGGGTFRSTASFTLTKNIGLIGDSAIDSYGQTLSYTGTVSGSNQLEINDSGPSAGIFDVTGATCSFAGGAKLTRGIYKINSATNMGTGAASILNGGTLQLAGTISSSMPALSMTASSTIDTYGYTSALSALTSISSAQQLTVISSTGSGVLDMTGATTSGFPGTTKITGATMLINAAYSGTGGMTLNGGTLKLAASVSSFPAISVSDNSTINTNGSGHTLTVNGGALTGTSGKVLTISGGGTMALTSSLASALAGTGISVTENSMLSASNISNQLSGAGYLQLAAGTTLKVTGSGTLPCGLVL